MTLHRLFERCFILAAAGQNGIQMPYQTRVTAAVTVMSTLVQPFKLYNALFLSVAQNLNTFLSFVKKNFTVCAENIYAPPKANGKQGISQPAERRTGICPVHIFKDYVLCTSKFG